LNAPDHDTIDHGLDRSTVRIDWRRFWSFLFRLVTGLGLVAVWLMLLGLIVVGLVFVANFVAGLSFAWILGVAVAIPMLAVVWYVCFWVSLDALSDMGIQLNGLWSFLVVPVAPLLATVAFFAVCVSGLGAWLSKPLFTVVSFVCGALILLLIAAAALLR
jgi:hypothetical protein